MEINVSPFKDDSWLMLILAYCMSILWRGVAFTIMWDAIIRRCIEGVNAIGFIRALVFMLLFDLAFKLKVRVKNDTSNF